MRKQVRAHGDKDEVQLAEADSAARNYPEMHFAAFLTPLAPLVRSILISLLHQEKHFS